MIEEWKKIESCEYEVSNLGRIRSIERMVTRSNGWSHKIVSKVLKPAKDASGYLRCGIIRDGKLITVKVHRVVCEAFLGKSKLEVNHIDGVKGNNLISNLEWISHSDNVKHAFNIGLAKPLIGELNPTSKIKEEDAIKIKKMLLDGHGPLKISRELGISKNITKDISRGKTWKHLN